MRAYERFSKEYALIVDGKVIGEYTTVTGAHNAAKRKGITAYEVKSRSARAS